MPLYLRENSLLPHGPEHSHVGERPVDPLTVEALVTTEAKFTWKSDMGDTILRCRRQGEGAIFGANKTPCTFILRLYPCGLPSHVRANGKALPHLESYGFAEAGAGWTMEGQALVVKAQARQIEIG